MRSRIAEFLYDSRPARATQTGFPAQALPAAAGLRLNPEHFERVLEQGAAVGFFEVRAETHMGAGGDPHDSLAAIREAYPLSLHGTEVQIAGEDPMPAEYFARLAAIVQRYRPSSYSEHLASCGRATAGSHTDLLSIPYDERMLRWVCRHVRQLQDSLGLQILLESPFTHPIHADSTRTETDFLAEVIRRTGCELLLNVNRLHACAAKAGREAGDEMDALPLQAVGQIRLSGAGPGSDVAAWDLLRRVLRRTGPVPVLIARNDRSTSWPDLLAQARQAQQELDRMRPRPCQVYWGCS